MTATANDVAVHVLESYGSSMGTMKLQKLVYYSQAYSLGWFKEPIFEDDIQAWVHGPVVRSLWETHANMPEVDVAMIRSKAPRADSSHLTARDKLVVKSVLAGVGGLSGLDLRERTHREAPWAEAFDANARYHNTVITHDAMRDYYETRA